MRGRRHLLVAMTVVLAMAACGGSGPPNTTDRSGDAGPLADTTLDRGDVDCSADGLGQDENTTFVAAHVVVDGKLGQRCFGEANATLLEAWRLLASFTPPSRLQDLALFGGFKATKAAKKNDPTFAFVNAVDDAGTAFQMSVNLPEAKADRNEFQLTMAHEFSHVLSGPPAQKDRSAPAPAACPTFSDNEGCFKPGSYLAEWVAEFWPNGLAAQIDPNVEPSVDSGEGRCRTNAAFLNAYAASSPEEDFAESFAAYVFRVPVPAAVQPRLAYFSRHADLAEFQARAEAAGLGPLKNTFEPCG